MSFIDFQTKYDITHKKSMHIHHCCNILSLFRFLLFILVIVFLLLGYFWQNVCYGLAGVALIAFLIFVKFLNSSTYHSRIII